MPLYKKAGITLICMYAKTDLKNLKFALKTKLNRTKIKENIINFEENVQGIRTKIKISF